MIRGSGKGTGRNLWARIGWVFFLLGLFFGLGVTAATAAPKAEAWTFWAANDPAGQVRVDHGPWNQFLKKYVVANHPSGVNRVRYASVTPEDRKELDDYLQRLQRVEVTRLKRSEQKSYWIDLYNALTVKVVLDLYPVKSIRDIKISPGLFSSGPWGAKLLTIQGQREAPQDETKEEKMPRIPPLDPQNASGETADIFREIKAAFGMVPNLFRTSAHYPPLLAANWNKVKAVMAEGRLRRKVKETIALLVSKDNGCDYCVAAHSAALRSIGTSPEEIAGIMKDLAGSDFSSKERGLIGFARQANLAPSCIPEEAFQALKGFGATDAEIVEALGVMELFAGFNKFLDSLHVDIDFPRPGA